MAAAASPAWFKEHHSLDPCGIHPRRLQGKAIGGGLGPLEGNIRRIGLMGAGSTRNNVLLPAALKNVPGASA